MRSCIVAFTFRAPSVDMNRQIVPFFENCYDSAVLERINEVRSGTGAYAGAARRRVHFATVLPRPPSGHPPRPPCPYPSDRTPPDAVCGLCSMWTPRRNGPAPWITTIKNPMCGILSLVTRLVPVGFAPQKIVAPSGIRPTETCLALMVSVLPSHTALCYCIPKRMHVSRTGAENGSA